MLIYFRIIPGGINFIVGAIEFYEIPCVKKAFIISFFFKLIVIVGST